LNTELESISGIGEKTVIELLTHFKSTKRIIAADFDSLVSVVGESRAKKIITHFQKPE
jgi:excinuclease ABC subunit C